MNSAESLPGVSWDAIYDTPRDIERDLDNFKYAGPGWYNLRATGDVMLITIQPPDRIFTLSRYRVQVWNQPDIDPRQMLSNLLSMRDYEI